LIDFNEIAIHDKPLFDGFLDIYKPVVSELTFTNLFAWRRTYGFRYTIAGGLLCIIAVPENGDPFAMMPVGKVDKKSFEEAYSALKQYFGQQGWRLIFKKIAYGEVPFFKDHISSEKCIVYDRDNSDYLYRTSDLISLKGKKYDGKRNHIKKFERQNEYEYLTLESKYIDKCVDIMDQWCKNRDCSCKDGENCERDANLQILNNFDTLGCTGAIVKVNGAFEAFTIGEMLNDNTAVIHIEKAKGSIDGLYTFINQQFAKNAFSSAEYINREQDLGIEGLRRAKLSYHPVNMIDKYIIYPD
jgi:hypothetical protein